MTVQLDRHCSTCNSGRLRKTDTPFVWTMFCARSKKAECCFERSPTGSCGQDAKRYKTKQDINVTRI